MPITLMPFDRRDFLRGSIAAGAALVAGHGLATEATGADPHRFALLSDTHVWAKRDDMVRGVNMAANLRKACEQFLAGESRPSGAFINGDCAYLTGEPGDYSVLMELLGPVRKAGVPVHMAMGNHDQRENFWKAFPATDGQKPLVEQRHVTVVESPRANWFVLDSLDVTNKTPGICGATQLKWLADTLDARADHPALVMVHHHPDEREMSTGLVDTRPLLELLVSRRHVKGLFFGHTHNWSVTQGEGFHLINLPPTAYVFAAGKPNGWVDVRLFDDGMQLELRCFDEKHAEHGRKVDLKWRA